MLESKSIFSLFASMIFFFTSLHILWAQIEMYWFIFKIYYFNILIQLTLNCSLIIIAVSLFPSVLDRFMPTWNKWE